MKPRTMDWLIKLVDVIYKSKIALDDQRAKTGLEPLSLIEVLFSHLTGVYGTKDLVNQHAAQTIATLEEFRGVRGIIQTGLFHPPAGFVFMTDRVKLFALLTAMSLTYVCLYTGRCPPRDVREILEKSMGHEHAVHLP